MAVEKAKNVPPFVLWCSATIPTAFDDSMSYYEALCALNKWIQDNIIGVVNNNADILEDYIKMADELKKFVEDYFKNLDVQEEINNKLDEMAEGGQLAAIIAEFLAMSPVFGYGTIAEMASATNLNDGCIARVIGNSSASAGDGAYYLIRTRTQADDPDGLNLVAIGSTLVGVRVQDAAVNAINERIDNLDAERVILIGDSYSLDRRPSVDITGWAVSLQNMMGLTGTDCYTVQDNGGGFVANGSTGTFLQGLQALSVTDKDTIKKIVVCGGLNDCTQSKETILTAISTFVDYCNENYPNAKIYIGHIGNDTNTSNHDGQYARFLCKTNSIPAYKDSIKFGVIYLNGVEFIMKDYANFYDQSHPNQALCDKLAAGILQAINAGSLSVEYPVHYSVPISYDTVTGNVFTETSLGFTEVFTDNKDIIANYPEWTTTLHFATAKNIDEPTLFMGVVNFNYIRNVFPYFSLGSCEVIAKDTNDDLHYFTAMLELYYYNNASYLVLNKPATSLGNIKELSFRQFTMTIDGSLC